MPTRKLIIDTDPGVDDILAIALAFLTHPNDVEIALITPVFGNTSLYHTVRNTVTLLTIIDQEREWRAKHGFRQPRSDTPIVAMGEDGPIDGSRVLDAKEFHGKDGIGEVHTSHPHFTPENHSWEGVLDNPPRHFVPSSEPAYVEILKLLDKEPKDTVTIVAVGPLSNVAKAAQQNPKVFSKVREVIVMGGSLILPGNVTPAAEFNIGTDPDAASILFSLTSPTSQTHPSAPRLPRCLKLILVPLDATQLHGLPEAYYTAISSPAIAAGSPLSSFLDAMLRRTYKKVRSLVSKGRESKTVELHMHDPLCVYYAMMTNEERAKWVVESNADVRVECAGTWTRGMTVLDMRTRGKRPFEKREICSDELSEGEDTTGGDYEGVDDDEGGWRGSIGNALDVIWASSSESGGNIKSVEAMGDLIWNMGGW